MVMILFGHRGEEGIGGWRRLHNEKLNTLFPSPNIIRVVRSGGRDGLVM
jgi:hypothetical protein